MLAPDHLIGRAPEAALRLAHVTVSWRHASVRWTGHRWELQDLGSRNGTFLDGSRVGAGERVPLRVGAQLRFGEQEPEWLLICAEPPHAAAVALDDNSRIAAVDGLIVLPDVERPELSIYRHVDGTWVAEGSDRVWEPCAGEVLVVAGRRFRFEPGAVVHATSTSARSRPTPTEIALEFVVSRNEEQVAITIVYAGKRMALRPRAHGYLLLTLARVRITDQREAALPPSTHGWTEQPRLLKMLATTPAQLALDIYRARRQFSDAGVVDAAQLVERRTGSRELRIGVEALAVTVE
jgi:hypothetical protein